jgi:hypothetical protein
MKKNWKETQKSEKKERKDCFFKLQREDVQKGKQKKKAQIPKLSISRLDNSGISPATCKPSSSSSQSNLTASK